VWVIFGNRVKERGRGGSNLEKGEFAGAIDPVKGGTGKNLQTERKKSTLQSL